MAATHALITAVCSAGDHVVIPGDLYGGTYRLVDTVLTRWGLGYDMVDQRDLDAVRRAIRPETRLVWVETPTNPALNVIDVAGVIEAAGRDALVAVDNTFATRAVHAGLEPDPSYGSVVPAIHQSSTYVQPSPGQFVEDYDYSRAANTTRRAL